MGSVTNIKRAQKTDAYHIYVDGQYSFTVDALEFSAHEIVVGQDISEEETRRYQSKHTESRAHAKALRYVSVRPRSIKETRDYLAKNEEPGADEAIERLMQAGILDDKAFAQTWVRERSALKPRSKRMLIQELRQKGVGNEIIQEVTGEIDREDQIETIVRVIEKKRHTGRYDEQKLIGYLIRQGYEYDLIKQALEQLNEADE